jgi:hypothetical protein
VFCDTGGWMAEIVADAEVSVAELTTTTGWNGTFAIEDVLYGNHELIIAPPSQSACATTEFLITVSGSESKIYMLQRD